ncbi:MAG: hypothetical protein ACI93R_001719 [Flavobacteriales bacterium]|jgi:hypothetical protein
MLCSVLESWISVGPIPLVFVLLLVFCSFALFPSVLFRFARRLVSPQLDKIDIIVGVFPVKVQIGLNICLNIIWFNQ